MRTRAIRATNARARAVTAELFSAYSQDPVLMDEDWIDGLSRYEPARSRHIADYIAGMTDRFAIARYMDSSLYLEMDLPREDDTVP